MFIGIAGPSCSGKSTVSRLVALELGARILQLDSLWIKGSATPPVNGHPSYDRPEQYDGMRLLADVRAHAGQGGGPLVVEGFLIFTYPGMVDAMDLRFFLDVPHHAQQSRRMARGQRASWDSLRNDDEKERIVQAAWMANGQQEWASFGEPQRHAPGVEVLDGLMPPESLARHVVEKATSVMQAKI